MKEFNYQDYLKYQALKGKLRNRRITRGRNKISYTSTT